MGQRKPPATTPEEWVTSRCQHADPGAWLARFCEATAQTTCAACGRRLCGLHDREGLCARCHERHEGD